MRHQAGKTIIFGLIVSFVVALVGWSFVKHHHVTSGDNKVKADGLSPSTAAIAASPDPASGPASASMGSSRSGVGAASFQRDQACFMARVGANALRETVIACESLEGVKEAEGAYRQCQQTKGEYEMKLSDLSTESNLCTGTDAQIAENYRASTKLAAQQGNIDAQLCYLESAFGEEVRYPDQEVRDYDRDAAAYIQLAYQRGDWRVVELLGRYRFHPGSGLLPRIAKGDVKTRYQMNRLMRLGSSGKFATALDALARHDLLSRERTGADALTPQQISEAERTVRDLYSKYFSSSPPLTEKPKVCVFRLSS